MKPIRVNYEPWTGSCYGIEWTHKNRTYRAGVIIGQWIMFRGCSLAWLRWKGVVRHFYSDRHLTEIRFLCFAFAYKESK